MALTHTLTSFKVFLGRVWALAVPFFRSEQRWQARGLLAAIVALAEDDGAAARRHAEAALRLRPTLDEARVLLARVCELEGDAACVAAARGPGDAPARRAALAPSP